jgi:type III secretion system YscD/HrpQ family protein
MNAVLELRVLSGPALGAAIELGPGSYTVGSDDGCDVVLAADSSVAARHLSLDIRVAHDGAEPITVLARPRDAEATMNGAALPQQGARLPKGEAVALGFTALAWKPLGEEWGPITLVPLEFARATLGESPSPDKGRAGEGFTPSQPTTDATTPPENTPTPNATTTTTTTSTTTAASTADANPDGRKPTPGPSLVREGWKKRRALILEAAFAVVLAVTLAGIFVPNSARSRAYAVQKLNDALAEAGFVDVRAQSDDAADPKAVVLSGTVDDDARLQALLQLASNQSLRTHVDVRVRGDALRILRETLNAHGFFPEVRYLEGVGDAERIALTVYAKDGFAEARMMALAADAPRLKEAARRMVYADEVKPALARELKPLGLDAARAVWLDGKVELPYRLTAEAQIDLDAALNRVRKTLNAPVMFEMRDGGGGESVAAVAVSDGVKPTPDPSLVREGSKADDVWGGLRVVGVTSGKIPFVTTHDGQKFFPGAVLPGGAVLTAIRPDRLVIQNGGKAATYPLRED